MRDADIESMSLKVTNREVFERLKGKLGKRLGSGCDGVVYEYETTKAIKFSWDSEYTISTGYRSYGRMRTIFSYVKKHRPKNVVRVYGYGELSPSIHYVIMERLYPLKYSGDVARGKSSDVSYFLSLVLGWNRDDAPPLDVRVKKARELNRAIARTSKDLWRFADVHEGNVMQGRGCWKLVDLEGYARGRRADGD